MTLSIDHRLAIHELLARYTHALDYQGIDCMRDIWTPDCRFQADNPQVDIQGIEPLIDFFHQTVAAVPHVRHVISNIYVEGDNHHATLHAYIQAVDFQTKALLAGGRYEDSVVNTPQGWRIQYRRYWAG